MVALQIRDVPENVSAALAQRARERGQSLQKYLLDLVQTEARRTHNATVLTRVSRQSGGARSRPGETAAAIMATRSRREATLAD